MNAKRLLSDPNHRDAIPELQHQKLQFIAQNCSSSHTGCTSFASSLSFAPLFTSIQPKPIMKPLFKPSLHLAAVAASVSVNVLLVVALDATLASHPALSVSRVQLPSVTVVAKRKPLAPAQLAAAGTSKSF